MLIQSTRFGEINVSEETIFKFLHGLPGFPEEKEFALLPYQPDSPFNFMQSLQDPDLAFMVVEPFLFFREYTFELEDQAAAELGISEQNPPQIFTIVTIPESVEAMTANLLAPVVINNRDRTALQIVLDGRNYTTRHRLFPNGFPKAQEGGM